MRTTAVVLFALLVIACRSPRDPNPPARQTAPEQVAIELDAPTREKLALGVPLQLELRAGERTVGACTLAYDLWDERYKVSLSRTDIAHAPDPIAALRMCLDTEQLADLRKAWPAIRVREAPHLYQPRADYPVF